MGHLQGNSPNDITLGASSYLSRQTLHSSLVDTEKTYSGLTDGCAAAGRVGCKLVEIVGDGASGDDVKNLINDAHDVVKFLPRPVTQLTFFFTTGGPPALSRRIRSPCCPWVLEAYEF